MSNTREMQIYRRVGRAPGNDVSSRAGKPEGVHYGYLVTCHSAAPPAVAEYEEWFGKAISADPRGKSKFTGAKLRRAVVMRRGGEGLAAIGRALGVNPTSVSKWLNLLPEGLAA